jgi:hypothetical protein
MTAIACINSDLEPATLVSHVPFVLDGVLNIIRFKGWKKLLLSYAKETS